MPYSQVIFKLNKLNTYAIFGAMYLAVTLLASGMYSTNQIFAQQENEAEINADIEQENKCKKDTECENENELNNLLNITTVTQTQQQEQPETPTCETCFTEILTEGQLAAFIDFMDIEVEDSIASLKQLCEYIEEHQGEIGLDVDLSLAAESAEISKVQYEALIQCLQDAGLDVDFPNV